MVLPRRSRGRASTTPVKTWKKLVQLSNDSDSSTEDENDNSKFEFAVPRGSAPMTRSRSGLLKSQLLQFSKNNSEVESSKNNSLPSSPVPDDSDVISTTVSKSKDISSLALNHRDNVMDLSPVVAHDSYANILKNESNKNLLMETTSSFVDRDHFSEAASSNEKHLLPASNEISSNPIVFDDNGSEDVSNNEENALMPVPSSSSVIDENTLTRAGFGDENDFLLQSSSSLKMDEDFDIAKFTGISTEEQPVTQNITITNNQKDSGYITVDTSDEKFLDQFPEININDIGKTKKQTRRQRMQARARTIAEYAVPCDEENVSPNFPKKEEKVTPNTSKGNSRQRGSPFVKRRLSNALVYDDIKKNSLKRFKSESDNYSVNDNILNDTISDMESEPPSPQFGTDDTEASYREDDCFEEEEDELNNDYNKLNENILDYDLPFPNMGEDINFDVSQIPKRPGANYDVRNLGDKGLATFLREKALTTECIEQLYNSLMNIPKDVIERDPQGLTVRLMPHQRQALSWMKWREQQKPVSGGILADDMGLGKTLQLISLVLATKNEKKEREGTADVESEDDFEDDWIICDNRRETYEGRTLVICPPSLTRQWEREVKTKIRRGKLRVYVFHGNTRLISEKRLAKFDIVITTYNLIKQEYENFVLPRKNRDSRLFKIKWERVILDEAHYIRNFRCKGSEAVCELETKSRWALTGTPIQNKEDDLYALIKFLKCSPFDEFPVWRKWVSNKNAEGNKRLVIISKSLMLRRTKAELIAKEVIQNLPDKRLDIINVKLDPEEKVVYQKLLLYSQSFFHAFLRQKEEKEHLKEFGCHARPNVILQEVPDKLSKLLKILMKHHAQVEAHYILVLILRLRQMCCHPSLIKSMLDKEDIDFENEEGLPIQRMNSDLLRKLDDLMTDDEDSDEEEFNLNESMAKRVMSRTNPVFKLERPSAKVRAIIDTIDRVLDKGEKVVVVSQWTSFLGVIARHLNSMRDAKYEMFTGKVSIKDRQQIVDRLNDCDDPLNILLLSLTAGGVGLNLVGANNLLLVDLHWNPQWETQAQDRIYRFGQENNVHIYKFLCKDTIEDKIKKLQDEKLKIANRVLEGTVSNRLTIEDLKLLFS